MQCMDSIYTDLHRKGYKILQSDDIVEKTPEPPTDAKGKIIVKSGQIWLNRPQKAPVMIIDGNNGQYYYVYLDNSYCSRGSMHILRGDNIINAGTGIFVANNLKEYIDNGGIIE